MKLLREIGRWLFLAGFLAFVGALFTGSYTIDETTIDRLAAPVKQSHREALFDELRAIEGSYGPLALGFLSEVNGAIDRANERLDDKIWDYDRGQYAFHIAREASHGPIPGNEALWLVLTIGLACLGGLLYSLPRLWLEPPGIKNNGVMHSKLKHRGWIGIATGIFLIGFYVMLYFYPATITNWIRIVDPVSRLFSGNDAGRWFFYGFLYTLAVAVMGVRMLVTYRHSKYFIVRTLSVIFFQTGFAFVLPEILSALNKPWYDFKNAWPLDYDFFYGWNLEQLTSGSAFGWFILFWGIGLAVLAVPLLAVFFGKRWYCSWVCGCGGLAETLGDPFRHLSDKRLGAWKVERWMVHAVLVFVVAMTGVTLVNHLSGLDGSPLLGDATGGLQKWYGFLIGSIFAGVVGTGFYPFMGNRVWCRFGCPLAAILGIVQKYKSRFRITTNGGQCISCGNCSTYCEMGIDVRWYAQRGQNIIRASCVGCGVCSAVCPRGVLRLENGPEEGRYNETSLLQLGGKID